MLLCITVYEVIMLQRTILDSLRNWAESDYRKVLILRGARQVGKTTAVRMFSQDFDTYIELNMEIPEDKELFENYKNVNDLYNLILLKKGKKPIGRVLLFIDEIQGSSLAMASLRFFYENMPHLYVIASGSLLELYLQRERLEIPVGRVQFLWMHPLSFDEFLLATGRKDILQLEFPFPDYSHPVIRDIFLKYALIGGLPEAVMLWLKTNDIVLVRDNLNAIMESYRNDMIKYPRTPNQAQVLRHVMNTAYLEVGKQISFEGFGGSSYRSLSVKNALEILELCRMFKLLYPYTSTELPSFPQKKKRPKLLYLDIGLLNVQAQVMADYFGSKNLNSIYKGAAMEVLVGQMLMAMEQKVGFDVAYWKRDVRSSTAELDFILPWKGMLIPVEVKAGKTGTLKSLFIFMDISPLDFAVRIYDGEYKLEKLTTPNGKAFRLLNLPLALTPWLFDYLKLEFFP